MSDNVLEDDLGSIELKAVKRKGGSKGKHQFNVSTGVVHVSATFQNTIVSITDVHGNVMAWSSAGKMGYKGSKKKTAYAAQLAAVEVSKRAMTYGVKEVEVWVKGPGSGRESAVRGVVASGLEVKSIKDITPVPHNGCRPPKKRRI